MERYKALTIIILSLVAYIMLLRYINNKIEEKKEQGTIKKVKIDLTLVIFTTNAVLGWYYKSPEVFIINSTATIAKIVQKVIRPALKRARERRSKE